MSYAREEIMSVARELGQHGDVVLWWGSARVVAGVQEHVNAVVMFVPDSMWEAAARADWFEIDAVRWKTGSVSTLVGHIDTGSLRAQVTIWHDATLPTLECSYEDVRGRADKVENGVYQADLEQIDQWAAHALAAK